MSKGVAVKSFYKYLRKLANNRKKVAFLFVGNILASSVVFDLLEKERDLFDSLWWTSVTATTVGYGDIYPAANSGRLVGLWLMYTSIIFFVPLVIAHIVTAFIEDSNVFTHEEQEALKAILSTDIAETQALAAQQRETLAALSEAVELIRAVHQEVDTLEEEAAEDDSVEDKLLTLLAEVRDRLPAQTSPVVG